MIKLYTVIGQPIAHSMSPEIHHLFGELTQRRLNYSRTESTADTFSTTVKEWREAGGHGCNITLPFKQLAANICDRLSSQARCADAVNTILMHRDGNLVGHNTDGSGLRTDLQRNLSFPIAGRKLLLLGAGGAARGVLAPLLEANPASIHIANRTAERALELATIFDPLGPVSGGGVIELSERGPFDLVINATSMSLQGELPELPENLFSEDSLSYDMMYGANDTVFMSWSREHGAARVSNGFGMLIEQAADAFLMWEGVRPKTRMVYPRLRKLLNVS